MHDSLPLSEAPLIPPAPYGRTILVGLCAAIVSLGLTTVMESRKPAPMTGTLQAHTFTLTADRPGRIAAMLVQSGDVVTYQQAVVQFADEPIQHALLEAQGRISTLEVELNRAKAQAEVDLQWRLKELEAEILETRLKSAAFLKEQFNQQLQEVAWREFAAGREELAESTAGDLPFHPVNYSSETAGEARIRALLTQEAAQNAAEVSAAQVKLCEQRLAELEQLKQKLPSQCRCAAGVELVSSRLQLAQQALRELERQQQQLVLRTPAYGTVGVFRKAAGDTVAVNEPIVEILDQDQRFIVIPVPSERLGQFSMKRDVEVEFPSGETGFGRVSHIPPQASPQQSSADNATVAVRIEQSESVWPELPIGTQVTVTPIR